jgi:uncharacterized protein YjbI with pentapeptide repeats
MHDVDAEGASFEKAELARACLRKANLRRANFTKACLAGADLSGAHIQNAVWDYADMNFGFADGVVPMEELLEAQKRWKLRVDAEHEKFCADVEEHSEK